ncbi:MAG: Tetratricopeptide repeat-like domain [Chthoniobacter sp.]|jgi:TolA-binding protein|nr:Tetratricopeptide repeat-like domain [Chthoniobacter sp.]
MPPLRSREAFATFSAPMASPTQTSPPSPAPATGFDPLVFWVQHGQKVLAFAGLFAVALAIYFISEFVRTRRLTASAQALAEAHDAEGFRKVMVDYAATPAAGNAALLLGEDLRKQGKLDESAATLRTLIDKDPDHPLISGAWTSLAATQEAQGKQDEALSTYQKVSTTFATSFSAPVSLLAQARIFREKGKADEAKRLYEQVINQFQDTTFAQQAMQESQQLKK